MKKTVLCKELFNSELGVMEKDMAVMIKGNIIVWVGSQCDLPAEKGEVIDLNDKYLLPGLIDAHVHTSMDGTSQDLAMADYMTLGDVTINSMLNAQADLMAGFTTIRDEGSKGFVDVSIKKAINAGRIIGPRMFVSGPSITATGGHADHYLNPYFAPTIAQAAVIDSPDAGRKAARMNFKYGADQIKVMATGGVMSIGDIPGAAEFTEAEMKAILEVPLGRGRISSAHAHGADGIKMAIRCGITSIEHGMMMDDECIDMMLEHGTYLVPTIIAAERIIAKGTKGGLSEEMVSKATMCIENHGDNLKKCRSKGVKIAFGSDAGTPNNFHGRQAYEFELLQKFGGFTTEEVLIAATKTAAELMQLQDKIGCVKVGAYADLVAVETSPFEDIATLKNITFIMKDGTIYKN